MFGLIDELREAITHALAAPDFSLAASLMEKAAPTFWLRGETRTIHTWISSLFNTILVTETRDPGKSACNYIAEHHTIY